MHLHWTAQCSALLLHRPVQEGQVQDQRFVLHRQPHHCRSQRHHLGFKRVRVGATRRSQRVRVWRSRRPERVGVRAAWRLWVRTARWVRLQRVRARLHPRLLPRSGRELRGGDGAGLPARDDDHHAGGRPHDGHWGGAGWGQLPLRPGLPDVALQIGNVRILHGIGGHGQESICKHSFLLKVC